MLVVAEKYVFFWSNVRVASKVKWKELQPSTHSILAIRTRLLAQSILPQRTLIILHFLFALQHTYSYNGTFCVLLPIKAP